MAKKVVLVGHCGPDSSFLKSAVRRADAAAEVVVASGMEQLQQQLDQGADLILFNRILDYGYEEEEGVALMSKLTKKYPFTRMVMVSNYEDARQAAVKAGGWPGFGKREIGTERVTQLLRDALEGATAPSAR